MKKSLKICNSSKKEHKYLSVGMGGKLTNLKNLILELCKMDRSNFYEPQFL